MDSDHRKRQALREARALHRKPESVIDPLFRSHPFFDPHDKVQVKYEMLRRHELDGEPLGETARRFGFTRQSYRLVLERFRTLGFVGLFERKRGRKQPLKADDEVVAFVRRQRAEAPDVRPEELAERVQRTFGVTLSRRTIYRALSAPSAQKKKHRDS